MLMTEILVLNIAFLNILDYGVKNDGSYPNNNVKGINDALYHSSQTTRVVVFPAVSTLQIIIC